MCDHIIYSHYNATNDVHVRYFSYCGANTCYIHKRVTRFSEQYISISLRCLCQNAGHDMGPHSGEYHVQLLINNDCR